MENKNTSWFFGDSFTQMACINEGSVYQKWKNKKIKSWTKLISDFLNTDEIVIAKGGKSTQEIYFDCINNYKNIKEGDYIFITDSPYVRTVGINRHNVVGTFNNEQLVFKMPFERGNDMSYGLDIDYYKKDILLNYVYEFILPYETEWKEYWKNNLFNLTNIFEMKNVKVMCWSYNIWENFTSIDKETNGKIYDLHWGEVGNLEFYEYLKKRIENNQYILETEWKDEK